MIDIHDEGSRMIDTLYERRRMIDSENDDRKMILHDEGGEDDTHDEGRWMI